MSIKGRRVWISLSSRAVTGVLAGCEAVGHGDTSKLRGLRNLLLILALVSYHYIFYSFYHQIEFKSVLSQPEIGD
ncbi:hypothetical protein V8C42DRAFT_331692 [Trichoderma barbatum]